MKDLPPITITREDRERLYNLLDAGNGTQDVVDALYQELERARIVEPGQLPADVVSLNSRVRFINEDDGSMHDVRVVLPRDHRPGETVSVLAPAGAALLGTTAGDSVTWPGTNRTLRLKLVEVEGPVAH